MNMRMKRQILPPGMEDGSRKNRKAAKIPVFEEVARAPQRRNGTFHRACETTVLFCSQSHHPKKRSPQVAVYR